MEFLKPFMKVFPFDETCIKIFEELEKRNFKVPGIEVKFDYYSTFKKLETISGKNFQLRFGRKQRLIEGTEWNDTAAIHQINIPKKELSVFDDNSGPLFYLYVGKHWERDKSSASFVKSGKVNSKLNKQKRTYLRYEGSFGLPGEEDYGVTYRGQRAPYLVHTNDWGREYDPKKGEPTSFKTEEVFAEFDAWIKKHVLEYICKH
jgi:hypothetical protein